MDFKEKSKTNFKDIEKFACNAENGLHLPGVCLPGGLQ